MADKGDDIVEVKEELATITANMRSLTSTVEKVVQSLDQVVRDQATARKFPTGTVAAFVGVGLTVLLAVAGALWLGLQLSLANTRADLATQQGQLQGALAVITSDVSENRRDIAALQQMSVSQGASLKEVETQFCGTANVINLMHHQDLRDYASLYQKVMGQPYPAQNPFDPTLCWKDGNH